jgi:hypothetical protein
MFAYRCNRDNLYHRRDHTTLTLTKCRKNFGRFRESNLACAIFLPTGKQLCPDCWSFQDIIRLGELRAERVRQRNYEKSTETVHVTT